MSNEWFYAACAKIQINDDEPFIVDFQDTGFRSIADEMPSVNFEDLAVLALLSPFFTASLETFNQGWMRHIPPLNFSIPPTSMMFFGTIFDSPSTPNYPENSASLACFTKEMFRASIIEPVPYNLTLQEWQELVKNTPFNELQALLTSYEDTGRSLLISATPATLKITRCSQTEIENLDPFGGLDSPYVDIFDLVKSRLTNTVNELYQKGLAPAKYYSDGEYIEFVAECSVSINESAFAEKIPT